MTVYMVLSRNCIVIVNILYLYRLELGLRFDIDIVSMEISHM